MTARAALVKHLLSGKVINIKTCFNLIGLTNAPRELSRMIENPKTGFGVTITRTPRSGKTRYGTSCTWYDYKLEHTEANANGIEKMAKYLLQHDNNIQKTSFKTDKEQKANKQEPNQEKLF